MSDTPPESIQVAIERFVDDGHHATIRQVLAEAMELDPELVRATNLGDSIGKQFPARLGQVLAGLPRLALLTVDAAWDEYVPRVAETVAYARRLEGVLLHRQGVGVTHVVGPAQSDLRRRLGMLFPEAADLPVDVDVPDGRITADPDASPGAEARLSLDHLIAYVDRRGLVFAPALLEACLSALDAGKHVMLTGPPGTGKTSLAETLADFAVEVGVARGRSLVTASADWTSVETVGAYRLRAIDETLVFRAGHVVAAIEQSFWLVIDELNRAEIDKAIGQLFTTLSGQAVTLPFDDEAGNPIAVVPEGQPPVPGAKTISVPRSWRLIATMNDRDQDLLFEMSEALVRRFAVIRLDPPDAEGRLAIIGEDPTGIPEIDRALVRIGDALDDIRPLGPAILLDVVAAVRSAVRVTGRDEVAPEALLQIIRMFVEPQLAPSEFEALLERAQLRT